VETDKSERGNGAAQSRVLSGTRKVLPLQEYDIIRGIILLKD
jgi:hypothetical protein